MNRLAVRVFTALLLATAACADVIGIERATSAEPTAVADPAPDAKRDTSTAAEARAVCSADIMSDAQNCGSCGHDCAGGSCRVGRCQPIDFIVGRAPSALQAVGEKLYWRETSVRWCVDAACTGGARSNAHASAVTGFRVEGDVLRYVTSGGTLATLSCRGSLCQPTTVATGYQFASLSTAFGDKALLNVARKVGADPGEPDAAVLLECSADACQVLPTEPGFLGAINSHGRIVMLSRGGSDPQRAADVTVKVSGGEGGRDSLQATTLAEIRYPSFVVGLSTDRLAWLATGGLDTGEIVACSLPACADAHTVWRGGRAGVSVTFHGDTIYFSDALQNRVSRCSFERCDDLEVLVDGESPAFLEVGERFLYWIRASDKAIRRVAL